MKDFKGKTAFVTGGASGIGLAIARAFGRRGMSIALADIDPDAANTAAAQLRDEQIKAEAIVCDVGDRSAVERAAHEALAAFGKVHVVCNNAGVAVGGPLGTVRPQDWDWIIDVNLKGVVYGMETFLPLIRSHGEGGHVVNTASMAGMLGVPGLEPYCATKFAVVAMTEGWALQLAPENIGVSVLCPGFVRTRIHESGRARPERYGGAADINPGVGQTREEAVQNIMNGLDPDLVGARVVEAIENGELYIFTHPDMRAFVEQRFEAIRSAFDAAGRSPALAAAEPRAPASIPNIRP